MKYENKSFSLPSADIYASSGWEVYESTRPSKGEWVKTAEGKERWYPKGARIPVTLRFK